MTLRYSLRDTFRLYELIISSVHSLIITNLGYFSSILIKELNLNHVADKVDRSFKFMCVVIVVSKAIWVPIVHLNISNLVPGVEFTHMHLIVIVVQRITHSFITVDELDRFYPVFYRGLVLYSCDFYWLVSDFLLLELPYSQVICFWELIFERSRSLFVEIYNPRKSPQLPSFLQESLQLITVNIFLALAR